MFVQTAHEPTDIGQALSPGGDHLVDGGEFGVEERFAGGEALNQRRSREQGALAVDDLVTGPRPDPIGIAAQDDVEVIAHHRVGGDVDGEDGGELLDALDDPAAAMLEVTPAGVVLAAQEGAAHAAGDTVVVGRGVERDEFPSCPGHGCHPLRF